MHDVFDIQIELFSTTSRMIDENMELKVRPSESESQLKKCKEELKKLKENK